MDQEASINTNERLLLEFISAETARAGQCHASIRHMAGWLNLHKNVAQKRLGAILTAELVQRLQTRGHARLSVLQRHSGGLGSPSSVPTSPGMDSSGA